MDELVHFAEVRNVKGTMLPYLNTLALQWGREQNLTTKDTDHPKEIRETNFKFEI